MLRMNKLKKLIFYFSFSILFVIMRYQSLPPGSGAGDVKVIC